MMKLSEMLESYRIDRPDEWTMDILKEKAEKLEAERDALVAQVEVFKSIREEWKGLAIKDRDTLVAFIQAVDKAPQQSLAEIKAQAGRAGYLQGHLDALGDPDEIDKEHSRYRASQYAESIRKGVNNNG